MVRLDTIDWIIFSLIILFTFLSVLYGNLKKHQTEDSFLDHLIMGRRLTLPLFTATLVATWYGGIFGVTKIAFEEGIYNFVTQGLFWYLAYIVFAIFLVDKIKKYNSVTLPELVGELFGPRSAKLAGILNFLNVVPITYTISIGLFVQTIFGGDLLVNMAIGIVVVLLYSLWGGFRAVVYSDLVQFFVMCIAVLLVLVFSITKFGGISFLTSSLPAHYFSFTGKSGFGQTFAWGLIAFSTLVDPNFYQRCFAAKSEKVAKRGILISTVIWVCFDLCTTFGAMYARAVMPDIDSANGYLVYSLEILPSGLRGFFLAGIFATVLSTLDSYIFIAGTTLSYDLFPKIFKKSLLRHHLGIIFVGIFAIMLAKFFDGNIKQVWKTLGGLSSACLLFPVLFGYFYPKQISDRIFVWVAITTAIVTALWRNFGYSEIDELYIGVFFSISALIFLKNGKRVES